MAEERYGTEMHHGQIKRLNAIPFIILVPISSDPLSHLD